MLPTAGDNCLLLLADVSLPARAVCLLVAESCAAGLAGVRVAVFDGGSTLVFVLVRVGWVAVVAGEGGGCADMGLVSSEVSWLEVHVGVLGR